MLQQPEQFEKITSQPNKYRVQIIYTQIIRDNKNIPHFKEHHYRLNPIEYFYPASTVKMPLAILALEKINNLKINGLTKYTMMTYDSVTGRQETIFNNPYSIDGKQTIAQAIKEIFLVSDNNAANRLFEFIGQEQIHSGLATKGYTNAFIRNRLEISRKGDENRQTQAINFYDDAGKLVYQQTPLFNKQPLPNYNVFIGNGYLDNNDSLINAPLNFSEKNRIYLSDLHQILRSVLFPDQTPAKHRFNLTNDDRKFLLKWMSTSPTASTYPTYDTSYYYANITKFLLAGANRTPLPTDITIYNKAGDAYGFLLDNAYIIDKKNKIEFLVSAVIYCNEDGILNDNKYDYETVGLPFMKNLGQLLYNFELKRKKAILPNFDNLLTE
jgi:beta-lactamase class A